MDGLKRPVPPWLVIGAGVALTVCLIWWFNRAVHPGPSPERIEQMIQGGSAAGRSAPGPAPGSGAAAGRLPPGTQMSPTGTPMPAGGAGMAPTSAPRPGGAR